MSAAGIEGLDLAEAAGSGACGTVFRATDLTGDEVAVKLFDAMSIQRPLLLQAAERLQEGGWPEGVMPVLKADYAARPAVRVTPWLADLDPEQGGYRPRSLQHRLDEHPGADTWDVVRGIASALAAMHDRRVAHGNLKPGNVFLDGAGRVLLTDWALGNMPGLAHLDFTDAVLYQAPEQLRNPHGYLEEAGYRWDVFAFGVLAYRLLTGRFPRCHETFEAVAPPPGESRREGIVADLGKIAASLERNDEVRWPDEAANELEVCYRAILGRCMALDANRRPATMGAVLAEFAAEEARVAAEQEQDQLLDQRRRADRRTWRASVAGGILLGAAVVAGALLVHARGQLKREKELRSGDIRRLSGEAAGAAKARAAAEEERDEAQRNLAWERDRWLVRLQASRDAGDRLFEWAMEESGRRLPPLEGRKVRLKKLEQYYLDFLARTKDVETLGEERARAMLQLAEVSLALGEAESAARRLNEALEAWKGLKTGPEWRLRVASDRVLYALLRQELGEQNLDADFDAARKALAELPLAEVDAARVKHLLAVLDLAEARDLARQSKDGPALEILMRATQALNELADDRPDTVVLRSELASCYLGSATILEGMGKLGDAREVRNLAVEELKAVLAKRPDDSRARLELAGTYGAMAEAAVVAGDVAAAVRLSKESVTMLDALRQEQPGQVETLIRLAAQRGLMAGLYLDRGQAADAAKLVDEGIKMLEGGAAATNPLARYRLALLWWQRARLMGTSGDARAEVSMGTKALDMLRNLEGDPSTGLRTEQIRRSTAYLLGDLAHAAETAGDKPSAVKHFEASVQMWEMLCKARPGNEEYESGLNWSRDRLKELTAQK